MSAAHRQFYITTLDSIFGKHNLTEISILTISVCFFYYNVASLGSVAELMVRPVVTVRD
jgi:hypothetical protein